MMRWTLLAVMAGSALGQTVVAAKPVVHPVFPGGNGTVLGRAVAGVLADPEVARAHVGVAVTAMDGTPLYGLNEGQLFRPASNAKLFTTAAAMAVLGPDATVTTGVFGKLDVADGVVQGDLRLKGRGDASFGTDDLPYVASNAQPKVPTRPRLKDLEELADKLVAKGVKQVHGGVVGFDGLFPWEPYPQGWDADDLLWGYGAPVSALSVADNQLKLTITPKGHTLVPGKYERFEEKSVLEDYGVSFYTLNGAFDSAGAVPTEIHVNVERVPGSRELRLYGAVGQDASPDVEEVAIDDPALFAAKALEQMLRDRGVEFGKEAKSEHMLLRSSEPFLASAKETNDCVNAKLDGNGLCDGSFLMTDYDPQGVLAEHVSAPLKEDVKFTLKVSQNLHAELLLHRLGLAASGSYGSTVEGARMVRAFLLRAGLDTDDFVFYDGSGLSTHDLVTPRATTQLLTYAATQPWFAPWKAALPVGGVDGSLSGRYKDGSLKGKVFAKTGTLGESRALSGYVECASGKTVAFSIFVDTHLPGHSEGDVIDKIVGAIAGNN